jgi:hypothetical protein
VLSAAKPAAKSVLFISISFVCNWNAGCGFIRDRTLRGDEVKPGDAVMRAL